MSDSTAQKCMCFHYAAHLKLQRQCHPAQEYCALKRKRCLAMCVWIAIRQSTVQFVIQFNYLRPVPHYFEVAPIPQKCSVLLLKILEVNNPGKKVRENLITMKGKIPEHPKFLNNRYQSLCPSLWVLTQFLSCCCSWQFKTNYFPCSH